MLQIEGLVKIEVKENVLVAKITSEITADNDYVLKKELEEVLPKVGENGILVIDLSECKYINSKGIGIIASVYNKILKSGYKMYIISLSPVIKRIFEITKLDKVFQIADNLEEVLEKVERGG